MACPDMEGRRQPIGVRATQGGVEATNFCPAALGLCRLPQGSRPPPPRTTGAVHPVSSGAGLPPKHTKRTFGSDESVPRATRSAQSAGDVAHQVADFGADGAERDNRRNGTSEAISVYSMAVAPCSFFIRCRKMVSIYISNGKNFFSWPLVPRPNGSGTAGTIDRTPGLNAPYLKK